MTIVFKVGDKVSLPHPGHCCANTDTAEILSLTAPGHPELFIIQFPNGVICNCQPDRLVRIKRTTLDLKKKFNYGAKTYLSVGDGWVPLIESFLDKLVELGHGDLIRYFDCKEKFSQLRTSFDLPRTGNRELPSEVDRLTRLVEYEANTTCMFCAGVGATTSISGWLVVACEPCADKERAVRKTKT